MEQDGVGMSHIQIDQTKFRAALEDFLASWGVSTRWSEFMVYCLRHQNLRVHELEVVNGSPVVADSVTHRVRFSAKIAIPSVPADKDS